MMKPATILATLMLTAGVSMTSAAAMEIENPNGIVMNYEIFENIVHHIDMENCPPEFNGQNVFCRLTIQHDQLNLVVFSKEGDMKMIAIRQVDLGKTKFAY